MSARIACRVVITLAIFCGSASAQEGLTILCVGEQSTGFNWRNGDWVRTNFRSERFLVEKQEVGTFVQAREHFAKTGEAAPWIKCIDDTRNITTTPEFKFERACYGMHRVGEKLNVSDAKVCFEQSEKRGPRWEVTIIDCPGMRLAPNGWFHRAEIEGDLSMKSRNEQKDSLSLEVGKCSVVK